MLGLTDWTNEELAAFGLLAIAIGYMIHLAWVMIRSVKPDE